MNTGNATEGQQLLHGAVTAPIIDSFKYLYRQLGHGFLESVYCKGLVVEMGYRGISVRQQVPFNVKHRGVEIGQYRADMVVEDRVLVEVKASRTLISADERQLINYLKASSIEVGLLLHFGPTPKIVRRLLTNDRK